MVVRVLVVGPLPPPVHGAARVTYRVAEDVRGRGADVVEVDSGDGGRRGGRGALSRAGRLLNAVMLICLRRVDVVYIGGAGGGLLWFQAVVVATCRLSGRRGVFHHHSFAYLDRRSPAMRAIVRVGGPRLVHVVLCSHMASMLRQQYASSSTVLVCSNAALVAPGADRADADTDQAMDAADGPLVLGHLSNLSLEKGLGVVLETFRRARARGLDVSLRLAGPTSGAEAARLVEEARVEFGPRLDYLGRLDRQEVAAFYATIDAFVFPSRYVHEAEPLVVLDAARHGVPSLVHAVGCLAGMVISPGHAVPRHSDFVDSILPELERLLDRRARAQASREARAWFDDRLRAASSGHRELVDFLMS